MREPAPRQRPQSEGTGSNPDDMNHVSSTAFAVTTAALLALSGCATAAPAGSEDPDGTHESQAANPRVALTYDGGVLVLDGTTLEPVGDIALEGFLRLNPAGDGRHVLVSTGEGFHALDTGAWTDDHGDHAHHFVGPVELTDHVIPAAEPGHAVAHYSTTALFADGSGEVTLFDPADLGDTADLETEVITLPDAHHGVAVQLSDGTLLATEGTHDARSTVVAFDADRAELTRTTDCPGVHGEAIAAGEVASFGCADGAVVFAAGAFTKVASPDAAGGIGTQAGSEHSPILLTDYAIDGATEPSTRVGLLDTEALALRTVDLGTSYSFRSLARGPEGEALVLGTDGALAVIDPATGELATRIEVLDPWTEPEDWQQPRPAVSVLGGLAYITDPATSTLHVVDLEAGEVVDSTALDVVPNELVTIEG